jgi:hypothetical protein
LRLQRLCRTAVPLNLSLERADFLVEWGAVWGKLDRAAESPVEAHLVLLRSLSQSSSVITLSIGLMLMFLVALSVTERVPYSKV